MYVSTQNATYMYKNSMSNDIFKQHSLKTYT